MNYSTFSSSPRAVTDTESIEYLNVLVERLKADIIELKFSSEEQLHFLQEKNNILIETNGNLENSLHLKCQELEDLKFDWNLLKDKYETAMNTFKVDNIEIEAQNETKNDILIIKARQKSFVRTIETLNNEIQRLRQLNSDLEININSLNVQQKKRISRLETLLNDKNIEFAEMERKTNDFVLFSKLKLRELQENESDIDDHEEVILDDKKSNTKKLRSLSSLKTYTPNLNRFGWTQKAMGITALDIASQIKKTPLSSFCISPLDNLDSDAESNAGGTVVFCSHYSRQNINTTYFSYNTDNDGEVDGESVQVLINDRKCSIIEKDFWLSFQSIFDRYANDKCVQTLKNDMRGFLFSIVTRNMFEKKKNEILQKSVGEWEEDYSTNIRRLSSKVDDSHGIQYISCRAICCEFTWKIPNHTKHFMIMKLAGK